MNGYDYDGVLSVGVKPDTPFVVISGRTWEEDLPFFDGAEAIAIRGVGRYGDWEHAARFKAEMIRLWEVTKFYEDDPGQVEIIRSLVTNCEVLHVTW